MEETHAERRMRAALDEAEAVLRQLKDKHAEALKGATLIRERWDQPMVELRWEGADGIGRAIHATAELDSDMVKMYASAWVDDAGQDGLRRYVTFIVGEKSSRVIGYLWRLAEEAYLILSRLEKLAVAPLSKETLELIRKPKGDCENC